MWAWIPIVGPIIQAAINAYRIHSDTSVRKQQISSTERIAEGQQGVSVLQIRADVAKAFKNDVGLIFARDAIVNWYATYICLIFYDSCFRNLIPNYTWRVLAVPDSLNYLCMAIIAYLFVTEWRGKA